MILNDGISIQGLGFIGMDLRAVQKQINNHNI